MKHYSVVIVGGGQAGLSISYRLKERGFDHIVFEKNRIGYSWRSKRWDSFCLVTPNWQCKLPGYHYIAENDTHGFMQKDKIVKYIEDYAQSFGPPLEEGVEVLRVRKNHAQSVFEVTTSIGDCTRQIRWSLRRVAIISPRCQKLLRGCRRVLYSYTHLNTKIRSLLPDQGVLVVGTGQSGCQIAEDLHLAGKKVHLCVGGAPRSPRLYRGKDVVDWLDRMGYYDLSIDEHPQKEKARTNANHYVTGRDGGREIDLRRFALEGMQLYGRLKNVSGDNLELRGDLKQNLAQADAVSESIKKTIDAFIEKNRIQAPTEPPYKPVWEPEEEVLTLDYKKANVGAVVWCTGYQSDFSWVEIPVFDGRGYPGHERGITDVWGLYFLGLPWLHTWGSARFSGIDRDATYLADYIVARRKASYANEWSVVNEFLLGS